MYEYSLLHRLTSDDERAITFFLQSCKGFHYFQSPAFYNVCLPSEKLTPFYVIARHKEELVGVLLACRQIQIKLPGIRFLTSRNLIIGGPVVKEGNPQLIREMLDTYSTRTGKSLYTQIRNLQDTTAFQSAFIRAGFTHDDHLDILIDLRQSEEELWKGVHSKRRNEIRRAEKEGCRVDRHSSPESLAQCYNILTEVYRRAKLPLPDVSHFEAMLHQSTAKTGLRIFTVVWEEQIIGCMLCLAYGDTLYDYFAGAYSRYYAKYPNDLLPWEVFKWAKNNGFSWFDFGGAGKPTISYGVREYKKKFGGELVNYGRYERIHFPMLYRLATKLFALWRLMKR